MFIARDQHDKIIQIRHDISFQYLSHNASRALAHNGLEKMYFILFTHTKKFIELKYWPILNEMALLTIEDSIISKENILFYCSFYLVITVQEFENM